MTGFGNYWYRATGDKNKVNIQQKKGGKLTWKTIATLVRSDFTEFAKHLDIYNPYNQNPTHMLQIARLANYDD